MAANKKTFIFYSDWINMVREMPNEHAGELLKHILSYVNDEDPQTENLFVKMAFGHMKPMLKKDLEKWDKQKDRFSEMGKKSAAKRQHKPTQVEPTLTQVEHTSTVNDNVNVNVNDNVNVNENTHGGEVRVYHAKQSDFTSFKELKESEEEIPFKWFWDGYDKKVGSKKKCEKKWSKLSYDIKNKILDHLIDFVPSTPDKQFRPNPETYLNGEQWNNEIIFKDNQNGQTKKRGASQQELAETIYKHFGNGQ